MNNQYLQLKDQYNNAQTQEERDNIVTQMNQLQEQKVNLDEQLAQFNNKLENGPEPLSDNENSILIAALKQIQDKYPKIYIEQLRQDLAAKEAEYDDFITNQRKNHLDAGTGSQEEEVLYLGSSSSEEPYEEQSKAFLYIQQEVKFNTIQVLSAFARTSSDNSDLAKLASILKVNNVLYREYLVSVMGNNMPQSEIITAVANAIEELATFIVKERVYK